jgi:hypothetical protein
MAQSWEKLKGIYDDFPGLQETGRLDLGNQTALTVQEQSSVQTEPLHLVSSLSYLALERSADVPKPQLNVLQGGKN